MKFTKCLLLLLISCLIFKISARRRNRALLKRAATRGCNLWTGDTLPADQITLIVQTFNDQRNNLALGNVKCAKGESIPKAANMRQVYWSTAIAAKAQEWANNCKFKHSKSHFRKQGNMKVGENIFTYGTTGSLKTDDMFWKKAIDAWYNEVKDFDVANIKPFKSKNKTGHFTQNVWAETYLVGCGFASFKKGKWNKTLNVCEFGPAGNFINQSMLAEGEPASACPEGTTKSTDYPGLCCISGNCTRDAVNQPTN